jgi:hypothetical protein
MPLMNKKGPFKLSRHLTTFSIFLLFTYLLTSPNSSVCAETQKKTDRIRIQDLEKINDPIASYIVEILALAIKKSGQPYVIEKLSGEIIPQVRQILDMSHNRGQLDVIWTMTSDEREAQILPIRVPIDKGFFGWRIAFVNGEQANLLHSVKTQADLAKFKAGQGYLWPDTEILRSNGLPVVTGSDESLANMLMAKRFDYFPRPIIAIWNEQKNQKEFSGLAIDNTFVLHYPTAFYFFVAPKQTKLAQDLTRGLERAVADGSFDLVFNKYFRTFIEKADINNRIIFELHNPLIKPNSLPLDREKFWFHPENKNKRRK